jgi:uncharacterized Zn-finger protein
MKKYSEVQAERLGKQEAKVREVEAERHRRQQLVAQLTSIAPASPEAGAAREKVREAVLTLHADPAEVLCDGCGAELWHIEPGVFYETYPHASRKVGCPGCGWTGLLVADEELPRPKPWAQTPKR